MKTPQKWIGLLIVLGIGVGFYYYFVNKNSDVELDENVDTTTEDVSAVPDSVWKTYTNNESGFLFKYPPSVGVPEEVKPPYGWSKSIRLNLNPNPFVIDVFSGTEYEKSNLIYVYNDLLSLNTDFDGYQVKTMDEPDPDCYGDGCNFRYIWEKVVVGGVPALDRIACGGGDACSRTVYILSGASVFRISSYGNYFEQNCDGSLCSEAMPLQKVETDTDFDRVLSTFKFTK